MTATKTEIAGWIVSGDLNADAWEKHMRDIRDGKREIVFFGCVVRGALCFDLTIRDLDNCPDTIDADAYLLGKDTGYGYTKNGTPYDESDGFGIDFDPDKGFDENLAGIIEQVEAATRMDAIWTIYANKAEPLWANEI